MSTNEASAVDILSDITVYNKYAKFTPALGRRENWTELVLRNCEMHARKYPQLADEIYAVYGKFVLPKKILPSMRSLQFGGRPIEFANNRIYNCAYLPINHSDAFSEMMFLLLGGSGGGYSVQYQDTKQLPTVQKHVGSRRFLIGDSIEGWADTIKVLVESYFNGKARPDFIYDDIREKGAPLITSGGKAPGPAPLKACVEKLSGMLDKAQGRKLTTLEVHDMVCHIADAVLAGGIRRAALICLFDRTDQSMLTCKAGAWYEANPQRGRANNSVVLPRGDICQEEFMALWDVVKKSGCGEPGFYWTNDTSMGTNPCCEIALNAFQFCNLVEINSSNIESQKDLNERSVAAAFLGTLQAGYTDFHYLRPIWKETTEREALLGVGMTGIGSAAVLKCDLEFAADLAVGENVRVADIIGINYAARVTTVKPAGTSSLVLGSSSGIHAWHNDYYIRRMRVGKDEALYVYMLENMPELVEDDVFNPLGGILSFPQKAPEGAILRTETPLELLERVARFNKEWVGAGHLNGNNAHNVSCTISLGENDWEECGQWMWDNRMSYHGISVLPHDGGTYVQAPFEDCTKEVYEEMLTHLKSINLDDIREIADNTDLAGEAACAGGACDAGW